MLNMSKSTIHNHFVKLGYINCFDVWIPHDLTEKNLMDRISICDSFYKRNEETPFLKQVVTRDKKWTIYNNIERKRSWGKRNEPPLAILKTKVFIQRRSCSVFDGIGKGSCIIILIPNNEKYTDKYNYNNKKINSEKYCFQLDELKIAIEQKRPEIANRKGVMFH